MVGSKEEFVVVIKGLWSGCPNDGCGMKELLVGSNEEMMVVIT